LLFKKRRISIQLVVSFFDPFIIRHLQKKLEISSLTISVIFKKNDVLRHFFREEMAGAKGASACIHQKHTGNIMFIKKASTN
jgi:hypothetical protein